MFWRPHLCVKTIPFFATESLDILKIIFVFIVAFHTTFKIMQSLIYNFPDLRESLCSLVELYVEYVNLHDSSKKVWLKSTTALLQLIINVILMENCKSKQFSISL